MRGLQHPGGRTGAMRACDGAPVSLGRGIVALTDGWTESSKPDAEATPALGRMITMIENEILWCAT